MIGITTHILDTSRGRPAAGVGVTLERRTGAADWTVVGDGRTDDNGRLTALAGTVAAGTTGSCSTPPHTFPPTAGARSIHMSASRSTSTTASHIRTCRCS